MYLWVVICHWLNSWQDEMEKVNWTGAFISLSLLTRYNMTMGTTTWPIASYPCYNDFLFMMDSTLELWSKLNPSFVTLFKSGHFVTPVRQITKIRTVKFIYQPSSLSSKMIQSLTRKEIIRRYLSRFQLYSSLYSVMIEACYSC